MCVVPLGGLAWAAFGGAGGGDETAEATAETAGEAEASSSDDASTSAKSARKKARKKRKGASSARGTRKVSHAAAACCEALRTLGRETDDVTKRPTYLAAASACEAAPTEARARTQVRSIVEGSRLELPSACQE
jgi:hypothetical protein